MISPATHHDIPELVALINSAYRGESSRKGWTTEADLIEGLRTDEPHLLDILNSSGTTLLKYTEPTGRIIGCVRLQKQPDGRLYLGMLTVTPVLQGQGIGRQLLAAAEHHAQRERCHTIYMTVFSVRTELIAWYERHGYRVTGEIVPFQPNEKFEIIRRPLEFQVLEKKVE